MSKTSLGNKILKGTVLILGGVLVVGGITSYISYILDDAENSQIENKLVEQAQLKSTPSTEENIQTALDKTKKYDQPKVTVKKNKALINQEPLPALHDSDEFFLSKLNSSRDKSLFIPLDIIRNMVVFIDNFSRGELVGNFSPLNKPSTKFSVTEKKGILVIDSKSFQRYDKYAQAINDIDVDNFVNLYSLLTPLIDEAYSEVGYPVGSFNITFDKAIDHVLETPIIHYKLEVESPSVMYKYSDKHLESLPDTQKLMLRMGPDNLQSIQLKLSEIQAELQRL